MDVLELSRIQFAMTAMFHFIFPSITIGLAGLIAITETLRWRTKRDVYDRMSVFWTKLFAVTFVVGVATGIVMEFEFGTNWSLYAGYVGDIFGAPLAAEGVFAFFLESGFVGLMLFGRKRVSSTVRWLAAILVAVGTTLSAFWILVANSWMQTPAGFKIVTDANGVQKAELTDFWAAVFNASILPRFFHTMSSTWVAAAFFMLGISAWYILRRRHLDVARQSVKLAIVVAFVGAALMFVTGDWHTREVASEQPLKFAAMEGVYDTTYGAPLTLWSLPPSQTADAAGPQVLVSHLLSFMLTGDWNGQIKGLNQQPDQSLWPPVAMTFLGFHNMVVVGSLMLLLMVFGAFYLWRRTIETHTTWLRFAVLAIPLPLIAIQLGWMTAEVGRQPWIVEGLMKTASAGSPGVSAGDVALSLGLLALLYLGLAAVWLYALVREIAHGPEPAPEGELVGAPLGAPVGAGALRPADALTGKGGR